MLSSRPLRGAALALALLTLAGCGGPVPAARAEVAEDAGVEPLSGAADASVWEPGEPEPDGGGVVEPDLDAGYAEPPQDAGGPGPVDAGVPRYENIVLDESGDPFCGSFGSAYYLYLPDQVSGGGRVIAFTSRDLVHWSRLGSVFNNVNEAYGGRQTIGLWAPEVLSYGGKYYLYYVNVMNNGLDPNVGDKDIAVVESSDPADFTAPSARKVLLDGDYAFIDPSPYHDPVTGQLYLLFKRRGAYGTGTQLMIRPMSDPLTFSAPATVLITSADVPNAGQLEHPELHRAGGKYFLLFSKGLGDTPTYQVVYATSTNPTGPFTYRGALFEADADLTGDLSQKVIAPGASSIVRDGAGKIWMVYRQKKTTTKTFADRGVCIDEVTFDPANNAIHGAPTKGVWKVAPTPLP